MRELQLDFDERLKAIQITNAEIDTDLKRLDQKLKTFELDNKPGFWKGVLASPAFLAAVVAVCATAGSAFVTVIVAQQQRSLDRYRTESLLVSDRERNEAILNVERTKLTTMLVSSLISSAKADESCSTAQQLMSFLGEEPVFDKVFFEQAQRVLRYYKVQCDAKVR
jgi:hypothetical protein